MMRDRLIYGSLAVFSAFVGLMLAGGPSALNSAAAPDGRFPIATTVTTTTIAIESSTSERSVTTDTDTDDSIASETTVAPDSTALESSTSTSVGAATTTTTSTAPGTDVPGTDPPSTEVPNTLRERADLVVAVANGRDTQGAAGRAAAELVEIGYLDPATRDAPATLTTTVFYADGLEQEASRLAVDVGLAPTAIASVIDLPDLEGSATDFELVLVLGTDVPG